MKVVSWCFVLLGAAVAGGSEIPAEVESLRTWEVVRRECWSSISRQEVTLFGNGTVRLKDRFEDKEEMRLAELEPQAVQAYLRRLEGEDLSEVPEGRDEVLGPLVERCGLFLALAGQ